MEYIPFPVVLSYYIHAILKQVTLEECTYLVVCIWDLCGESQCICYSFFEHMFASDDSCVNDVQS